MLLLLRLIMTAMLMLRGRGASGDRGMGGICQTCLLWFHMTATAGVTTVASFTNIVPNTSFTLSLRLVMMNGPFDVPILSGRRRRGRGRAGR